MSVLTDVLVMHDQDEDTLIIQALGPEDDKTLWLESIVDADKESPAQTVLLGFNKDDALALRDFITKYFGG